MSFFEDASLVLIPSGIKDQKVYSVKPTDGSGDLTFSRASNATRVGPDGLIEKVRTNLLLQSETFSNASWVKDGSTFSGDTLTAGAGTAFKGIYQVQTTQGVQVNYFDVAYVDHQWVQILVGTAGSDLGYANFDIQNKVVGSFSGIISATIQDFGTYIRLVYAINTTNKTATNIIFVDSGSAGRAALTSSTGSFKLFRAQVETGDIATDYIATTSAAVSVGPVSGLPRLDYLNSSCPRLILEPTRTNELQFSEQADNAYWTKGGITISANTTATLDPSGYNGADKLEEDSSTGIHRYGKGTFASGTQRTLSVFAKKAERDYVVLFENNAVAPEVTGVIFNLANGTVQTNNSPAFYLNPTIVDYGNGWYRCSVTWTPAALSVPSIGVSANGTTNSYAGTTGSGVYVWGAMLEQGAYASSYLNTLSTSVTRVEDAASKTGISSLIGQTEGTIFWEGSIDNLASYATLFALEGTSNSWIYCLTYVAGLTFEVRSNNVVTAGYSPTFTTGSHKIALAYNASQVAIYIDGVSVFTDNSVTIPATSNLYLAGWSGYTQAVKTAQALLFKTRLSNADLATLTTI